MRINKVTASAFGPLVDEVLSLAPGMTVIVGDNESAKSTWHAAIYAALCGRRRGKGAPPKDERRFCDLHRPWDEDRWVVAANITLDDGRAVEIHQDLDGKVDCRAVDMGMGASDISNEIMFEGSPDASRWLGLDRRSFAATATVNQAELLKILDDADGLQEALQRAVANAGTTDATAAAALNCLDAFRRDHVGLDRSNSGKPLRAAKNGLQRATATLNAAQLAHENYLDLVTGADDARQTAHKYGQQVAELSQRVTDLETLAASARTCTTAGTDVTRLTERVQQLNSDLAEVTSKLDRARELDSQFHGHAPAGTLADDDTATSVTAALADYRALPGVIPLTGPSSAELAAELAALPAAPSGDTAVAQPVRAAASTFDQAARSLESHAQDRPAPSPDLNPSQVAADSAGPAQLRELASELSAPAPSLDPALTAAVTTAKNDVDQAAVAARAQPAVAAQAGPVRDKSTGRLGIVLLSLGAAVAMLGVVAFGLGVPLVGTAAVGLGLLTIVAGMAVRMRAGADRRASAGSGLDDAVSLAARERLTGANNALTTAQARLEAQQSVVEAAAEARLAVTKRCELLQLPANPAELKAAAAGVERRGANEAARLRWERRQTALQTEHDAARKSLVQALDSRRAIPGPDPAARFGLYEHDCARNRELSAQASRREQLTREHNSRVAAEQAAAQAGEKRVAVLAGLRRAAQAVAVSESESAAPAHLVEALTVWQKQRLAGLAVAEAAGRDWAELGALLGGNTLADLEESSITLAAAVAAAKDDLHGARLAHEEALRERNSQLDVVATGTDALTGTDDADDAVEALVAARLAVTRTTLTGARERAASAGTASADADGALRERARTLESVAEAEERLQVATTELDRVLELDTTLTATRNFLESAQQRVHRDIAPVLATTLTEWLPRITDNRYTEAAVNPRTLQVKVCGPARNWRPADRLSRGTAEQIYLLLRVALARHLVTADAACPMLLDDVTVQADSKRTAAILDLLHDLSHGQQIIVFAQEQQVADWAHQTLTGPNDAVVEMTPVPCS